MFAGFNFDWLIYVSYSSWSNQDYPMPNTSILFALDHNKSTLTSPNEPSKSFFVASAAKLSKRDISGASERAFPGFQVWAIFWVAELPSKRGILVHKNSLACCQRYCHSVESRALTCPFKHSNLSVWSLLSWHLIHTYLWGRLCFIQAVCSPLSRSRRVTQIVSIEAFVLNTSLESFSPPMNW